MEAEVYIHNPKKFTRLETDADRVSLIAGFSYDDTLQQYSLVSLTDKTIELVSDSITLTADKIIIDGTTTFDSLFTDGTTTIDGSNITTGTITADELNVSSLSAISSNLGSITGGSINIGSGTFTVNSSGSVTASDMTITGGEITIDTTSSGGSFGTYGLITMNDDYNIRMGGSTIDPRTGIETGSTTRDIGECTVTVLNNGNLSSNPFSIKNDKHYYDREIITDTNTGTVISDTTKEYNICFDVGYGVRSIDYEMKDNNTSKTLGKYIYFCEASLYDSISENQYCFIYFPDASGTVALTSDITTALADYSTSTEVTNEISTALANYSTSSEVTSEINTALTNYPTTAQMNTALADYQGKTWTSISPTTVPVNCNEVMFELRHTTSQGYVQRTFTIIPTVLLKAVNSSYSQTIYIGDRATFGGVVTYSYSPASSYFNFSKTVYYNGSSVSGSLFTYYR